MSQVKVQGNPSGTGIFTIASPNSNSNYTFTLPTETGTVLTNTGPYTASSSATAGAVTIDASGNVGIGTSSPGAKLEVNGNIRLNGGSNTLYTTAADLIIQSGTSGLIRFANNNGSNENVRIDSSGNLLVGTTSALSTGLTVSRSAVGSAGVCSVQNTRNIDGDWTYRSFLGSNCNSSGSVHFAGTTGASTWYLLGNGTTTFSSDARLKKNIETTRDGYLSDLCQLRVVKYHWKNNEDSAPKELGLIAQEVEQVFPGLVMDQLEPSEDGETYKMVKGSVLPYILLKAIQELKAEVDALKAQLGAQA